MESGNLFCATGNCVCPSQIIFCHALALEEELDLERAKILYHRAVYLCSFNTKALVNLGTIYSHLGKLYKAEQLYRQAIGVDYEYALAHFNLANVLLDQGSRRNKKEAIEHYRVAIAIDPEFAGAYYNLALELHESGCLMEACKFWLAYLRLDHSSLWAEIARTKLDEIKQKIVHEGRRST